MGPWTIAILGTDTFYQPDADSEVLLSALSVTDPMEDENWLKVNITGMRPKPVQVNETEERVGGIAVQRKAQKMLFDCKTMPFIFPDDMAEYFDLFEALKHNYIYLFKGTYDFDEFSIHGDTKALMVACTHTIEDDDENGRKDVTLAFRKVYPI